MNNKNSIKTVHIYITGRVQGVSYRWWFKNEGEKRKLNGWVRNRTSNRVEAEIKGTDLKIDQMIEKCKTGSPLSNVENVVTNIIDELTLVDKNINGIKILETT